MAIEGAQKLPLDEAEIPQSEAEAVAVAPADEAEATPAEAVGPAKTASQEQERRLLAVRDINAKIGDLEGQIGRLTAEFGQSQQKLSSSLLDLQRRNAKMTAEIVEVVSHIDRNAKDHSEATRALDSRLSHSLSQLREQMGTAGDAIQAQQARLNQLESSQTNLQALHKGLAMVVRQNEAELKAELKSQAEVAQVARQDIDTLGATAQDARNDINALSAAAQETRADLKKVAGAARQTDLELKALTVEAREQLQINRTHIEGLNALHREQKQSLLGLAEDFELLNERTNQLADQLHGLTVDAAEHRRLTSKNFRIVAGSIAALAVVSFALMTWLHFNPSQAPDWVKNQLAALGAGAAQQAAAQGKLGAELEGTQTAMAVQFEGQQAQIEAMQAATERNAALIQRLQKADANMRQQIKTLQTQVQENAAAGAAPAVTK